MYTKIRVLRIIKDLRNKIRALKRLLLIDYKTNIGNYEGFVKCYDREYYRAQRYHRKFSIVILDIDNFKVYNDMYGHIEGDKVLVNLCRVIKSALRKDGRLFRYGGEEFVIILPEASEVYAAIILERVFNLIRDLEIGKIKITISAGIATYPEHTNSKDKLLRMADTYLYKAKKAGKDCWR